MKSFFLVSMVWLSCCVSCAFAENISTRFGSLSINDENILLYKNKSFKPPIQGSNSLSHLGTYQLGNQDIVVIQDNGGTGCPALLYLIAISASNLKTMREFGTCSDEIKVQVTTNSLVIVMPGFLGSSESEQAQKKAYRERHTYSFNGQTLKHRMTR